MKIGIRRRALSEEIPLLTEKKVLDKGGKIISGSALSARDEIEVCCAYGHFFKTNYDRLNQGKWCRCCSSVESGRKQLGYTVEDMQRMAAEMGGRFLSLEFRGVRKKHEFECIKHGSFWATPNNIIHNNQWCPKCWDERRNKDKLLPFDDIIKYVDSRNGKIVSNLSEYKNRRSRVVVQCHNGHQWSVTAAQLMATSSWCPHCKDFNLAGETITRHIFEATYGVPFPKSKPEWLKTTGGGCLELDGYNEYLGLAFEYQGPYHENPSQILRDSEKKTRCEKHCVKLIEIPYIVNPFPYENVYLAIAKVLTDFDPERVVILPKGNLFPSKLEELKELAKSKGGYLITQEYLGETTSHTWKCEDSSHPTWDAQPYNIRKGYWCAHCAGIARKDLKWLQQFAEQHQLVLYADQYYGANANYNWNCSTGHNFQDTKGNILQRVKKGLNACPICAKTSRHITVKDLKNIAEMRNGTCLSEAFDSAHVELIWRCCYGHEFKRNWNKVQQGYWCTVENCIDNHSWGKFDRFS